MLRKVELEEVSSTTRVCSEAAVSSASVSGFDGVKVGGAVGDDAGPAAFVRSPPRG